jgi:uncharacterized RDD family membrane protein YckC
MWTPAGIVSTEDGDQTAVDLGLFNAHTAGGRTGDNARVTLRRLAAYFIDWLPILGYAALLLPFGILLYHPLHGLPTWALNAGAFVVLVAPATVWLAGWERGGRRATPGKRVLGLRVSPASAQTQSWWRSLARNGLKLALPWELGHTSVYAFHSGSSTVGVVCALFAYGLLFVYLGYAVASGRTAYDRLTGTTVERVAEGGRRMRRAGLATPITIELQPDERRADV